MSLAGIPVPAAIRVIPSSQLSRLVEAADQGGLAWNANGLVPAAEDRHFLLPYWYEEQPVPDEEQPVPLWKCRVIALTGGLTQDLAQRKRIGYGRLDVPVAVFRRLPTTSRKVERQLLHWLAWKAAGSLTGGDSL